MLESVKAQANPFMKFLLFHQLCPWELLVHLVVAMTHLDYIWNYILFKQKEFEI